MVKYRRIINGECNFVLTELFNDVEKAADVSNNGEPVECKVDNLRIDFTRVTKDKDERDKNSSAKAERPSSEETREVSGSKS